ncbi:tetratricopeptide repeat protein [bacterium]|nr:tetratricopeptide repeat protein [bacterium]
MNLSKIKIGIFFLTIFLLLWLLYPSKLFLGYIYEGQSELTRAEQYYLDYLQKKPNSKFVIKRLSSLYKRMGEPSKALHVLQQLMDYRKADWEVAQLYLDMLSEMNQDEDLYKARLKIADMFINDKRVARYKVASLYDAALQHALWTQKVNEAYSILLKIIPITPRPEAYTYRLVDLDKGFKKTDKLLEFLRGELQKQPQNSGIRTEIVSILQVQKRNQEALKILREGLLLSPFDKILLMRITQVFNDLKLYSDAIPFAEKTLGLKTLNDLERISMMRLLATLYVDVGRDEEGIKLFERLTSLDENDRDSWRGMIDAYARLGNFDEVLYYMERYLKNFSDDTSMKQNMAETLLYKLKDDSALSLYREVLIFFPDASFAMDVANLLIEKNKREVALAWLLEHEKAFGNSSVYQKTLVSVLVDALRYNDAYSRLKKIAGKNPSYTILKDLIFLADKSGKQNEAETWAHHVVVHYENDDKIMEEMGALFYFWGQVTESQSIFNNLLKKGDKLVPSYWLGEIEYGKDRKQEAFVHFQHYLTLYKKEKSPSIQLMAKALKARGRMSLNDHVLNDYAQIIKKYPREQQFYFDVIDLLIENKKSREAGSYYVRYTTYYPDDVQTKSSTLARIAVLDKEWKKAIRYFKEALTFDPDNYFLHHDLAYVQDKNGQWKEALNTLESLSASKKHIPLVQDLYRLIRDEKSSHAGYKFFFNDLGLDFYMQNAAFVRFALNNRFYVMGQGRHGFYDVGSKNTKNNTVDAALGVGFNINPFWNVEVQADYTQSHFVKAPGFSLQSREVIYDSLTLIQNIKVNQAMLSTPQAIPAGGKEHTGEFLALFQPSDRLALNARYEFSRYSLKAGDTATGHVIEPGISYKFLKNPSLTAGYRLSFMHINQSASFLSQVNLLADTRTHYFSLDLAHHVGRNLYYQVGVFGGEDTKRNLHLFEGDLWGAQSNLKWYWGKNYVLEGLYRYGSESQSTTSGQSHEGLLSMTGYWK